jgi:hypothetical protein
MLKVLINKVRPGPGGRAWPRAIRSGTGRGGDVTGSRSSFLGAALNAHREVAVESAGRVSPRPTHTFGSVCDWRLT